MKQSNKPKIEDVVTLTQDELREIIGGAEYEIDESDFDSHYAACSSAITSYAIGAPGKCMMYT